MKKLLFLITTTLLINACNAISDSSDNKTDTYSKTKTNNHVLLFFDKTQSVDVRKEFVKVKYQNAIKNLIAENINNIGDVLEIYYIHENTAKAKCLSLATRTEKESTEGLNATDLEAAATNYDMSIQKERNIMLQLAIQKLEEQNTGSSNLETNISASIPIIADALNTKKNVKVYYFSDMVESIKTGRDFHKLAPISAAQATEWANTDVQTNKLHNLSNSQVYVILPFEPTSSSKENNPNVTDYWKTYFDKLGVSSITEL
jgi:hypothetical protein